MSNPALSRFNIKNGEISIFDHTSAPIVGHMMRKTSISWSIRYSRRNRLFTCPKRSQLLTVIGGALRQRRKMQRCRGERVRNACDTTPLHILFSINKNCSLRYAQQITLIAILGVTAIPTEGTSIRIQIAKPYRNLMMKALP